MTRRQYATQAPQGRSRAWAALGWFWAIVLGGLAAGGIALQVLGPPPLPAPPVSPTPGPKAPRAAGATPAPVAPAPVVPAPVVPAPVVPAPVVPAPAGPGPAVPRVSLAPPDGPAPLAWAVAPAVRPAGAAIPAPSASLQEPASDEADSAMLPRIGPGGQLPMRVYAAAFDAGEKRPCVAVLLAGIGMAEVASEEAIRATPAAVSLAISPYARRPAHLVEVARAAGHETLVSIPMEPLGYPLNDAGNHALLTGLPPAENHERLDWTLSRFAGYVGATAAMSGLRGERFGASEQMTPVLAELAGRGLLYVDPRPVTLRPGAPSLARPGVRIADLVIDDPPARADIEAKLARLEQTARDRGSALGVAGQPAPVTIDRLAAWTATLASRGIALVPVSALVPSPPAASPPR